MEIRANSFSLRGESGVVKIVSDSTFAPDGVAPYQDEAECDIIVESNGFRVNKAKVLRMSSVLAFLVDLLDVVRRRAGKAVFLSEDGELSILFACDAEPRVECEMNDAREGKENSVRVKYPIESSYFEELESELASFRALSATAT